MCEVFIRQEIFDEFIQYRIASNWWNKGYQANLDAFDRYCIQQFPEEPALLHAFCAAERPPVRLPAATQRCQRPGLIDHFMFNHNIIMLCHSLKQRVG